MYFVVEALYVWLSILLWCFCFPHLLQKRSMFFVLVHNDGGHQETGVSFSTKHGLSDIEADVVHSQKTELIVGKLKIPDVFSLNVRFTFDSL